MIDYLEYFAVFSGILYLILISKLIRLGWVFGIISAVAYTYICFNSSLYFQSVLQLIYVFTGILGLWHWLELKENKGSETFHLSIRQNTWIFMGAVISVFISFYLLSFTTQESAFLDSLVTIFSLVATVLTILRCIENWYYWWGVNALAMVLFYQQNLKTTVFLYGVYLIISLYGYIQWQKTLQRK